MSQEPIVLFTYSRSGCRDQDRWAHTGIASEFFEDFDAAKRSVIELRNEVTSESQGNWPPTDIERVEISPLDKSSTVALLNNGIGAIVRSREVVATIA